MPLRSRRRGNALIEFTLLLPVFLLLLTGIFDACWFIFHRSILDTAVAEGCRDASLVDPGESWEHLASIESTAVSSMNASINAGGAGPCPPALCTVTVTVIGTDPAQSLVCEATRTVSPLVGLVFSDIDVSVANVNRLEWQR